MQDFDEDIRNRERKNGRLRWMWLLFIIVGVFIVCLLILMFSDFSSHEVKVQEEQTEEISANMIHETVPIWNLPMMNQA